MQLVIGDLEAQLVVVGAPRSYVAWRATTWRVGSGGSGHYRGRCSLFSLPPSSGVPRHIARAVPVEREHSTSRR